MEEVHLLSEKQKKSTRQEVMEKGLIVQNIVNVLKIIGKQGLAFRASSEKARSLNDESINQGNFLEIFLLLSR